MTSERKELKFSLIHANANVTNNMWIIVSNFAVAKKEALLETLIQFTYSFEEKLEDYYRFVPAPIKLWNCFLPSCK